MPARRFAPSFDDNIMVPCEYRSYISLQTYYWCTLFSWHVLYCNDTENRKLFRTIYFFIITTSLTSLLMNMSYTLTFALTKKSVVAVVDDERSSSTQEDFARPFFPTNMWLFCELRRLTKLYTHGCKNGFLDLFIKS